MALHRLNELEKELRDALPEEIFTRYDFIILKCVAVPSHDKFPVKCDGEDIDFEVNMERPVGYLSGLDLARRYPENFEIIGDPIEAPDILGRINYRKRKMKILEFQEIYNKLIRIWIDIILLNKKLLYPLPINEKNAYANYIPEKGSVPSASANYKDLEFLKKLAKDGIEVINNIKKKLSEQSTENEINTQQKEKINTYHLIGDYWEITYLEQSINIKDSKAARDIGHLLRFPRRSFTALELSYLTEKSLDPDSKAIFDDDRFREIKEEYLKRTDSGDGVRKDHDFEPDEILDKQAKEEIKDEIDKLTLQINNEGSEEKKTSLVKKRIELQVYLKSNINIRRKSRKFINDNEKARLAIAKRIANFFKKVQKSHPVLHSHLKASVKTGSSLSYSTPLDTPTSWNIKF